MSREDIQHVQEETIQPVSAHSEEARTTDAAATVCLEAGLRFRAKGPNGLYLMTDLPSAMGGSGATITPDWLVRAGLAASEASAIALRAAQVGLRLTALEVVVESESDARGVLGKDESIPAGPLGVRVHIRIGAAGGTPADLQALVAWGEAHAWVTDALRRVVPIQTEVAIIQPEVSDVSQRGGRL